MNDALAALARSPRLPVGGANTTLELVKYDPSDKGAVASVQAAARIFKSAFGERWSERGGGGMDGRKRARARAPHLSSSAHTTAPVLLQDGRDLITLVCQRYVSPPEGEPTPGGASQPTDSEDEVGASPTHHDFDGFLVVLLRVGNTPVTAAVLR